MLGLIAIVLTYLSQLETIQYFGYNQEQYAKSTDLSILFSPYFRVIVTLILKFYALNIVLNFILTWKEKMLLDEQ